MLVAILLIASLIISAKGISQNPTYVYSNVTVNIQYCATNSNVYPPLTCLNSTIYGCANPPGTCSVAGFGAGILNAYLIFPQTFTLTNGTRMIFQQWNDGTTNATYTIPPTGGPPTLIATYGQLPVAAFNANCLFGFLCWPPNLATGLIIVSGVFLVTIANRRRK